VQKPERSIAPRERLKAFTEDSPLFHPTGGEPLVISASDSEQSGVRNELSWFKIIIIIIIRAFVRRTMSASELNLRRIYSYTIRFDSIRRDIDFSQVKAV